MRIALDRDDHHHDLPDVLDSLETTYFGAPLGIEIKWGRPVREGLRTRRLAAYYSDRAMIVISPVLDRAWVPRYFVEFLVFHEMCHHVIDRHGGGLPYAYAAPNTLHPPEFMAAEARYRHRARALAWEQRNLARITRPARARNVGRLLRAR